MSGDYVSPMGVLGGFSVHLTTMLYEHHRKQIRFPRSKKTRIRKKWAKRPENYKTWRTSGPAYSVGCNLYMTPEMWMELKKQIPEMDNGSIHVPLNLGWLCRPQSLVKYSSIGGF